MGFCLEPCPFSQCCLVPQSSLLDGREAWLAQLFILWEKLLNILKSQIHQPDVTPKPIRPAGQALLQSDKSCCWASTSASQLGY